MKKYKDQVPSHSIHKIRSLLCELGILPKEHPFENNNFYSCRISIAKDGLNSLDLGANGKGNTPEYSLASGYAEFTERIQNRMQQIRFFSFFILWIVCISCSGSTVNQKPPESGREIVAEELPGLPYHIDLGKSIKQVASEKLSVIAEEISYIPLETSASSLVKRIHEQLFFNHTILVSDFSNLYQFDKQGRFLQKIGKRGMGPTDHQYIQALVSNDDFTLLYVFTAGKMNVYNEKTDFIHSVKMIDPDLYVFSGLALPDDYLWAYLGAHYKLIDDTTTIHSFVKLDRDGNVLEKIPNSSPVLSTFNGMIFNNIPFYRYKDVIRFMDYGNDTLFTLSMEGKPVPYAICPLGSMKRELNTAGFNPQQMEALVSRLLIDTICEDERFLYITLRWGVSEEFQYVLFNKKTGEVKNLGKEGFVNDIDGGIPFFPQFIEKDGSKGMWIPAEDFIEKVEALDIEKYTKQYGDQFKALKQITLKVSPDDNPVLIIIK